MIQPQLAPASRRSFHALPLGATIDLLGLLVFGVLAIRMVPFPEGKLFVATLAGASVLAWLVIGQIRTSWGASFRWGYRYLAVPSTAAVVTLVVLSGLRDYYSGEALVAFVVGWTLWIGVGRYAAMQYSPRVRMLWIGALPSRFDTDDFPGLDVQVALRPPERWDGWDIVVAGTRVFESKEWRTWLLHAELGNSEIVSEYKAREILTGRVPLEAMREDLLPIAFHARTSYTHTKRAFDLLAVIVLSPLILVVSLIVALIVWFDVGAPVLYIQERVGRDGRPFRIFKFRTMPNGGDREPSFTRSGDDRVSPIGQFLRKFRLDEFPQFLNVIKGDMSIIGPRPEQVPFVDEFERIIPMYAYRHLVRPGITGWAQVGQGYAAGADETRDKLSYDLYYVKHQSLLLDVVIVIRTLKTILSGFGAR